MNLNLHIERLIVEGLPLEWRERRTLQAAIERQLAHLLATHGIPRGLRTPGSAAALVAPAMRLGAETGAQPTGALIGASIYAGLSGEAGATVQRAVRQRREP
jgi:hypothetical protein